MRRFFVYFLSFIILASYFNAVPTELSRIHSVISYIEENFDRGITSREIEDIAFYSYRNFQRVFMKIFGETVSGFQKRLRLENAYKKLLYTTDKVSDIALQMGYANSQSFSKAFHLQYGIAPLAARKNKEYIFSPFTGEGEQNIAYEIVYKKKLKVYCKSIRSEGYNNTDIDKLWNEIETAGDYSAAYGIITDQPLITESRFCRYEAAIPELLPGEDFQEKQIFGRKYARFAHRGSFENILDTYKIFYCFWLTEKPFLLDYSPVIEEYLLTESGENITYIYFPLHL
ncbi:AraC family transcriptional regulator [Elizabethkingia meningoseptica]|uniref:AraC family transcriptional regulator n=1 Tax=Elizabethkingia meningoseptica TaxID=238 RepID=UPI000937F26A|nr:AraC family transcriptional regulator [Elizabethkingia meningoseptica]MDE5487723.1 AraC family transcriptional regulator [Elizabethkingia meningoseptica]MVW90762.1 AraC family transcriptional regulator [Elizabethkingia meningoseptica]